MRPTVRYLQALGAEHLDLILAESHWVLDRAPDDGVSIFTCDEHLDVLPPRRVADDLAAVRPALAMAYLEQLLLTRDVEVPALHTQLARLYLTEHADEDTMLAFLKRSTLYDADVLLDAMPARPALPHVRAWLLGRLARHDDALALYIAELHDLDAAEAYCAAHAAGAADHGTALLSTLLRLVSTALPDQLERAVAILMQYASVVALDEIWTHLPADVPVATVAPLFTRALRAQASQLATLRVEQALGAARDADLSRQLRASHARHVLVSEGRTCAQCQRRLGRSVLAVIPASGTTMHYYCAMKSDTTSAYGPRAPGSAWP